MQEIGRKKLLHKTLLRRCRTHKPTYFPYSHNLTPSSLLKETPPSKESTLLRTFPLHLKFRVPIKFRKKGQNSLPVFLSSNKMLGSAPGNAIWLPRRIPSRYGHCNGTHKMDICFK